MPMSIKEVAWQLLTERMPFNYNFEWKVRENKRAAIESGWFAWDVLVKPEGAKRGRVFLTIVRWS